MEEFVIDYGKIKTTAKNCKEFFLISVKLYFILILQKLRSI